MALKKNLGIRQMVAVIKHPKIGSRRLQKNKYKVDELLCFGHLWPMTCQKHALQSPLQSAEETCTNYNQTNCSARLVLSWVSLWTQKRKAYLECIMPFRIMHLKSTWQCSIFGFFCLLKHGCLASIYSLHFCYAFVLCLFLL